MVLHKLHVTINQQHSNILLDYSVSNFSEISAKCLWVSGDSPFMILCKPGFTFDQWQKNIAARQLLVKPFYIRSRQHVWQAPRDRGKANLEVYVNQALLWIYISINTTIRQLSVTVSYVEFQNNLFADLGADTGTQTAKGIHTDFLRTSKNKHMLHSEWKHMYICSYVEIDKQDAENVLET